MARIAAATTHYSVLEVEQNATDEVIKRARRAKSLLVHPDKVGPGVAGASEAFQKVTLVRALTRVCFTQLEQNRLVRPAYLASTIRNAIMEPDYCLLHLGLFNQQSLSAGPS